MAIFNSYVKLPEGSVFQSHEIPISRFFAQSFTEKIRKKRLGP